MAARGVEQLVVNLNEKDLPVAPGLNLRALLARVKPGGKNNARMFVV
jgi:hypothetical protein